MTTQEHRAVWSLAAIFASRMFGLFMIYPVFSVFALNHLKGATPATVGLALGGYGLSQALLQIPLGWLSDRLGRKLVISGGLLVFAIGSVIAGTSTTIDGVIFGRVLQGAGAIGSTVLALAADLTRDEHRTRAMAVIGMSIGASFMLALVVGPVLNNLIGVPGMFLLTAGLAGVGIAILVAVVPTPPPPVHSPEVEADAKTLRRVLTNPQLLRLDFGVLTLHAVLTASFIALPLALHDAAGLDVAHQWQLYLPVLVIAALLMAPFLFLSERRGLTKPIFLSAIGILAVSELTLAGWHDSVWHVAVTLTLYFAAFTLMESLLPSLISRQAPGKNRGTAMGVYSTSQFLGIFIGGASGGWVFHHLGMSGVFLFCAAVLMVWLVVAATMSAPVGRETHAPVKG